MNWAWASWAWASWAWASVSLLVACVGRSHVVLVLLLVAACGGEPQAAPSDRAAPGVAPAAPQPAPVGAPRPDAPRLGPYPRSQFYIEHDLFLAADDPRMVSAAEASFLAPTDEVVGLIVGGTARAYAVTMLSYHHVVNDVIEGIPVAVTY